MNHLGVDQLGVNRLGVDQLGVKITMTYTSYQPPSAYTRHRHVINVSTVALCPLTSCCPYGLGLGRAVSGSVGLVGKCRTGSGSVGQCRHWVTAGFGGLVPSFLGKRLNPGDMILYSIIPAVTLVLSNGLLGKWNST